MRHPERVATYLEHINEAIDHASEYLYDLDSVAAFEQHRQSQDAVIRNIEIIGEAANRIQSVAPEFIAAHPDIPWADMRAMRNKVIHDYFEVD